jgi:hypothetical protein
MPRDLRRWILAILLLAASTAFPSGCASPEDGRARGGGAGADGGNYHGKPIHVPSKLDGTHDTLSVLDSFPEPLSREGDRRR